jgi:hypothetical protein
MATDIRNMEDVLVTALGISKKSRGLGYSATKVNPDELTTNRTPNPINSLEGKVAGVNITSLGTGPADHRRCASEDNQVLTPVVIHLS